MRWFRVDPFLNVISVTFVKETKTLIFTKPIGGNKEKKYKKSGIFYKFFSNKQEAFLFCREKSESKINFEKNKIKRIKKEIKELFRFYKKCKKIKKKENFFFKVCSFELFFIEITLSEKTDKGYCRLFKEKKDFLHFIRKKTRKQLFFYKRKIKESESTIQKYDFFIMRGEENDKKN